MKVLITGIAGFIGYHTAVKYNQLGWDVVGFDNFNDFVYESSLKSSRMVELEKLGIKKQFGDLRDVGFMDTYVEEQQPDLVIHLAAHAGVRVSMDQQRTYIENNTMGTQNLINACEDAGVENVIYASTSCTMEGNPLPWGPEEKLGKQLSPYGYTKQSNEHQFNISKIKNAVCLRFFTVYGPWGRPDMALFDFTKNIIAGKQITVYNNGDMKRDFTYVDDIVQGVVLVSQNMTERDTYCLGNGKQVHLMDFIKWIGQNLGATPDMKFAPRHPADALETWSDTTKLEALGYKPTVDIEEGVANFIDWYRSYHA